MSWMFAYGDLMGEHLLRDYAAQPALLSGYHRSFNHYSTRLWGSPERPCPVLGLAPGGECWGLAFRVPWLHRRRMARRLEPTENKQQYRRLRLPVRLNTGLEPEASVWVSDAGYAHRDLLAAADRATRFIEAHGHAGRGAEYVRTVAQALELWGLRDPLIEELWTELSSWRPR